MSIKVMNLVWSSTLEGTYKRFALLALADRASDQGEITALGIPNLCRKTGIKRSKMYGLLKELETEDELIQRVEQWRDNGSRKASKFWVNIPLLLAMQSAGDDERDQDEEVNPFIVSAAQPPVHVMDHPPSTAWTGPVHVMDGQGVHDMDGPRSPHGPLSPYPFPDTDPDPDARADGRTDEPSAEVTEEHRRQARSIVDRLDLRKIDARPKQVCEIRAVIAETLARGVPFDVVARHAEVKLREANTCKYFKDGFGPEYLSADPAGPAGPAPATVPAWCGQCDPEGRDKPNLRRVEIDGVMRRCPRCHPLAAEIATEGSTTEVRSEAAA